MFRGMVANLDFVRLLKEEDAGDCYSQSDAEILVPDFRVVTDRGESLLLTGKKRVSSSRLSLIRAFFVIPAPWFVYTTYVRL